MNYRRTSLVVFVLVTAAFSQIQPTYFGMSATAGVLASGKWPTTTAGSIRLWDTRTGWPDIQPVSPSTYDWSTLDKWLNDAAAHGEDVLYTLGRVPQWASSNPTDSICRFGTGQCDPPNDLNADGTGTNQQFITFVTALATHAAGRIQYWEILNEPQNAYYWNGTFAQAVRWTSDARAAILSIDPAAVIVSPGTGMHPSATTWTDGYFAAGAGPYVDIIGFHGYIYGFCPAQLPDTSVVYSHLAYYRSILAKYGQDTKPLFNTEASWGKGAERCFTDQNLQAGFVVQMYLMYASAGVSRFYWYAWNQPAGTLWNVSILPPGIAYQQILQELVGSTLQPCVMGSTKIWTCTLTDSSGVTKLFAWVKNGTKAYSVPASFQHYSDVYGTLYAVPTNGKVTISFSPLLFQP